MANIIRFSTLLRRKLKRFRSDDVGVTAVEFGLLAIPFFGLMGAILETAMFLLVGQVFDSAVDDASRTILIGTATNSAPDFKSKICETTFGLIDCNQIQLRIRPIASFASANTSSPVNEDGDWVLVEEMDAGAARQVMLVEAYYKWNTFFSFNYGFSKYGDSLILSSARVFVNEPGS